MNRVFCKIGLAALVAAVVFGCAKNKGDELPPDSFKRSVKVSMNKDVDTKTAVVEGTDKASFVWTDGDQDFLYIYENNVKGDVVGAEYLDDMKKATFTVDFNTSSATEYRYVAKYASEVSGEKNPLLPATQHPLPDSYDPSADVMVSEVIESDAAATSLQFTMHRPVTVNKMTLKGLTPGEKISRVEFELDKVLAGFYVENSDSFSGSDKKLTLLYDEKVVPSDGTFPVYFVCAPVADANIQSVVVVTDQNVYTKPASAFSKTISFIKGKMAQFGMNMAGYGSPISSSTTYTLITSESELTTGYYIIAAPGSTPKAMGHLGGTTSKPIHTAVDVEKNGNTIEIDNTTTVLPLLLTKTGDYWTIQNDDSDDTGYGKYIAWKSGGNYSTEQTSSYTWTIVMNTGTNSGTATIRSVQTNTRYFQYNASSSRFCCYENSSQQQNVALYKKSGTVYPLGISFENDHYDLIIGTSDYSAFTGQTVTKASTDTRTVTYSISGDAIGSINSSTGAVTLNGITGTATVTASVGADASHSAGSVTYMISVAAPVASYDLLNYSFIGVTDYTSKSNLVGSSGRGSKYATHSAGGTTASGPTIQIRTQNSNSGIVTTASGGKVSKIELVWNSATGSTRTVQVYGKNTAYSKPSDLYDSDQQGTLIGEMVKGTTSLTITNDYQYIGIRSKDGALYLDEIKVYWTDGSPGSDPVINVTSGTTINVAKEGGSKSISYSITNPKSGQNLSATSTAPWISNINVGASTVTFDVAAQASASAARSATMVLSYSGASPVPVTITQAAGEGGSSLAANGWLELPAKQEGSDYFNGVFKAGSARNYSYMYQYSTYASLWTAYPLYKATISTSSSTVSSSSSEWMGVPYVVSNDEVETKGTTWAANPQIEKALQVNLWDGGYGVNVANPPYVSDTYARGHQIPNADRKANGTMQSQTYYATNSTPQIQNRFNGYIWVDLENAVRACIKDTVYVVTGPVFQKVGESESITYIHPSHDSGKNVPVPNYYWKILLKVKRSGGAITEAKAIGFWFEHRQYAETERDFTQHACSVNQIEEWTGFDFFVNLPDSIEETAEANTDWNAFRTY